MGFELFTRNARYLFKYNIKHLWRYASHEHDVEVLGQVIDMIKNERELNSDLKQPKVLTMQETVQKLLTEDISFCRYGDGELDLIKRKDGVFQRYDAKLIARLKEILAARSDKLLVGINYYFYHLPENMHLAQEVFYRCKTLQYRHELARYIDNDRVYGDSLISMPYHLYLNFDCASYYDQVSKLWANQEIVMICGKTVFDKIEHNIFERAAHIEYIYGPRQNAFDSYDELLNKALATDPKKTKFLIMGPTATVLAHELSQRGHRAIDIGHLAKDYNSWKLQKDLTDPATIHNFYDKD